MRPATAGPEESSGGTGRSRGGGGELHCPPRDFEMGVKIKRSNQNVLEISNSFFFLLRDGVVHLCVSGNAADDGVLAL